jgi:hypothetical protein
MALVIEGSVDTEETVRMISLQATFLGVYGDLHDDSTVRAVRWFTSARHGGSLALSNGG